jgi:3'-phosphoadenosine 5'-phosphosulfate sulfotransferase (PAPS reductase)/FAD synthetase
MFSGGVGSWAAAKRVAEAHGGVVGLTLLFADTLIEDADTYRFLEDAAANVGAPLVRIADGRTPWELFAAESFLGNTRVDICSRVLKRELADRWLAEHYTPEAVTVYVGIDWSEVRCGCFVAAPTARRTRGDT